MPTYHQPYGKVEIFWQTIRLLLLGVICRFSQNFLKNRVSLSFLRLSSLTLGSIIYTLLMKLFSIYMDVVYNCKQLLAFDAVFLLDHEGSLGNVVGTLFFEPFEFETMKKNILAKTGVLDKGRSKLVKKYGLWFFQLMEEEEWNGKKD